MDGQTKICSWQPPEPTIENADAYIKWWSYTHIFLEWDKQGDSVYPCFGIDPFEADTVQAGLANRNLHKVELFSFDVENRDERRFNLLVNMEKAFVHFFKEVFEIKAFEQGYHYSFDLSRIGLPQKTYDEIMDVIQRNNLTDIWELIIFIIATGQKFYSEKVSYYESGREKSLVRNVKQQVAAATEVVDRVEKDPAGPKKGKIEENELLRINFNFQKGTIQINDPMLMGQFVRGFKEYYSNGYYNDWRLQLQLASYVYEESKRREQFRFRFAIALYNFLTQTRSIKMGGNRFPNNLMECILEILEFSLIRVGKPEHTKAQKIKVLRNWIQDHKLKAETTHDKVEPDFNKLYKYFDKEFINADGEVKMADSIKNGLSLCLQFRTNELQNEIIHICACLKQWHWRISQQLETGPIIQENALPAEYKSLKKFIGDSIAGKPFRKISIQVDGDDEVYQLTDRLPVHLVQSAVRQHYKTFREEYEMDILEADIKSKEEPGAFSFKTTGKFNQPEARFLPRFVDAFFRFLQDEAPALEKEFRPEDRYYSMISKSLHLCYYFLDPYQEDWQRTDKVKYWHSLVTKETKSE